MLKKVNKKIIVCLLILATILNITIPTFATLQIGDTSHLYGEKELPGYLEIKETGAIKLVVKVCYIDPDTKQKLPAFCIEPSKPRSTEVVRQTFLVMIHILRKY